MGDYMGCTSPARNKGQEHWPGAARYKTDRRKEAALAEDRETISNGPNDRPINETIAGTGPGIADDSLAPGEEEIPQATSDEEVEKIAEKLGSPTAEEDTLPLDGE
jgi:hypothetical protein